MDPIVETAMKGLLDHSSKNFEKILSKVQDPNMAAAVLQVVPPEFSGGPDDDVYEWVEKFERATTGLPDKQKSLLLPKAFVKAARHWFKDDLQPHLDEKDWPKIKGIILDRFSGQNKEDRYFNKLANLSYDCSRHGSLSSFADEFVRIYRKAYPKAGEQEVTQATVRAIPKQFRGPLGTMTKLRDITSVLDLKSTLKYFDQDVNIPLPNETTKALDIHKIGELLKDAVKSMAEVHTKNTRNTSPAPSEEHLYLARDNRHHYREDHGSRPNTRVTFQDRDNSLPRDGYHSGRAEYNNDHHMYRGQRPRYERQNRPASITHTNDRNRSERPPPGPCYSCGGNHWNRQCPRKNPNLN